jgi:hyperosmotically inducible protein
MLQRIPTLLSLLVMIAIPLAAAAAADPATSHVSAAPAKKPAKAKAAVKKPAAKPASPYTPGMIPPAMGAHRPPATSSHSHYDVPQAKSLAETPDVVLNSRVRASLMSALSAAREEDITPQTVKGVVTLTGSVKTKALRTRAEQVARTVHGVRAVKNQLAVK